MKDLVVIKFLENIIEEGTFTQAAKKLYVSQPYLSKYIKNIEEELGVELINREVHPIKLTYAGERYLSYMKTIKNQYEHMEKEMESISKLKKGRITLGIDSSLGTYILPQILPEFKKKCPGIEVELIEQVPLRIEEKIIDHEIDLYIGMLPIYNEKISYKHLFEDSLCLIVPKDKELFDSSLKIQSDFRDNFYDLDGEDFVLLNSEMGLRRLCNEIFKSFDINPNIVQETETVETASKLAIKGMGYTLVPEMVAYRNKSLDEYSNLDYYNLYNLNNIIDNVKYVIAYKEKRNLSLAVLSFLEITQNKFKSK